MLEVLIVMQNACEETKPLGFNPSATLRSRESFSERDRSELFLVVPMVAAIVEIAAAVWLLGLVLHISPVADLSNAAEPRIMPFENVERTLAGNH